jgi:hypothetical protein
MKHEGGETDADMSFPLCPILYALFEQHENIFDLNLFSLSVARLYLRGNSRVPYLIGITYNFPISELWDIRPIYAAILLQLIKIEVAFM